MAPTAPRSSRACASCSRGRSRSPCEARQSDAAIERGAVSENSVSIEIPRPPGEVFAYLVGLNDAEWRSGVREMRLTSKSHAGVGARHVEVRTVLGRTVETPAEVIEYEEGRRWAVRRASGRVRPQVSYTLAPLPTGTRLTSTLSLPRARGAAAVVRPLVGALAPVARKELARLREQLQRRGPAPEPARDEESGERRRGDGEAAVPVSSSSSSGNGPTMAERDRPRKADTPEKHAPDRRGEPEPEAPTHLPKRSWWATIKRTVKEFSDDNITDWSAALTYYAVLSFFPALLVLVALLGLVGGPATGRALMDIITQVAPGGAADTFRPAIEGVVNSRGGAGALLGVGLLGALWSASGYIGAFFRVSNAIWEIEEGRGPVKLIPLRLIVTIFMLIAVAAVVLASVISGPIARAVGNVVGLGPEAMTVWSIAKWPVIVLVVAALVAILFYIAPNARLPGFRWVTPGGVLAVLLAIAASLLFGVYVANFGKYNATYGALGGMIVFLLWLWIVNNALLFGSELDAEVERSRELHRGEDAEEELQIPPRAEPKEA